MLPRGGGILETMEDIKEKLKEKASVVKREARKQTAGYILSAFGLIAGLAWNDAVKTLIEYVFPVSQNTLLAKFFYAIIITGLVVVVSLNVSRVFREESDK